MRPPHIDNLGIYCFDTVRLYYRAEITVKEQSEIRFGGVDPKSRSRNSEINEL